MAPTPDEIRAHYASGYEAARLESDDGPIERERTRELLRRVLPPPPATILDVGGGPGGHACWLAAQGHRVHLVDLVPVHVEMAREASAKQPKTPLASAEVGDARSLEAADQSMDAVLLLGPLYHLTERSERSKALREASRVLRKGGTLAAAAISRFASALEGLRQGFLRDPEFAAIVERDLKEGQHRNPTGNPRYFMDTFFHHPDELRAEVEEAGFGEVAVYGIEGPGWLAPDVDGWWRDETLRGRLLDLARRLEREPALLGISSHLMAVATR